MSNAALESSEHCTQAGTRRRAISSQFAVKSAISNTSEGNQNMNMSIDGFVKLTYKYTNIVPSEFPLTTRTTPCRNSLIETQGGHRTFIVLATTTFRSQIGSKLSCRRCRACRIVECLNLLFDSMLIVSGICWTLSSWFGANWAHCFTTFSSKMNRRSVHRHVIVTLKEPMVHLNKHPNPSLASHSSTVHSAGKYCDALPMKHKRSVTMSWLDLWSKNLALEARFSSLESSRLLPFISSTKSQASRQAGPMGGRTKWSHGKHWLMVSTYALLRGRKAWDLDQRESGIESPMSPPKKIESWGETP